MRLYLLCEGMSWGHLPIEGGIYAQHPRLLDEWSILFEERAKHDRSEQLKQEREARSQQRTTIR